MKYEHIPKHKCMNSGPDLPMLLALHPVYKDLNRMSAPPGWHRGLHQHVPADADGFVAMSYTALYGVPGYGPHPTWGQT